MIYDKNQFRFNIILTLLLMVLIGSIYFFGSRFDSMTKEISSLSTSLDEMEKDVHYTNYIQGRSHNISYQLTQSGILISGIDDFGQLTGASMQPTIFEGNTLIEEKYSGQDLFPGDIVRYTSTGGQAVIHRVRAVYNETVHVQGDNLEEGEIINKVQITHIVLGLIFT